MEVGKKMKAGNILKELAKWNNCSHETKRILLKERWDEREGCYCVSEDIEHCRPFEKVRSGQILNFSLNLKNENK